MKLIIGLGNPGSEYEHTRHNIGFRILDAMAHERAVDFSYKKKFNAEVAKDGDMILAKPQTFMNNSGRSVAALADYFGIEAQDVIVVFDDKDIPFGTVRLRSNGSSGGHNGVQSVIQYLGNTDFVRIRIGVANDDVASRDTGDFVLARFNAEEEQRMSSLIQHTTQAVNDIIANGMDTTTHKDIGLEA